MYLLDCAPAPLHGWRSWNKNKKHLIRNQSMNSLLQEEFQRDNTSLQLDTSVQVNRSRKRPMASEEFFGDPALADRPGPEWPGWVTGMWLVGVVARRWRSTSSKSGYRPQQPAAWLNLTGSQCCFLRMSTLAHYLLLWNVLWTCS